MPNRKPAAAVAETPHHEDAATAPDTPATVEKEPAAAPADDAPVAPAAAAPSAPVGRLEAILDIDDWCNDSFAAREFSPVALETFRRLQQEKQRTRKGTPLLRATPTQFRERLRRWLDTGQE